jgi:hypothetical protein
VLGTVVEERDNIELLAEAVGLELDLAKTESPVGKYAVDLYAKELNTGRWVVIENQLEQTDHGHLGQLMAYAAGKEAGVVIWISPDFRDEHRQTLDWLNEVTDESVLFFGIELEMIQVGDSLPAPYFRLAVQPSERRRTVNPHAVSPRQRAYADFFAELLDKVKAKHPNLTKATRAYPQSWFSFPVGRSGFAISVVFGQGKVFRVVLYIDVGDQATNKAAFDTLREDREVIKDAIGQPVAWKRMDDKQASQIHCTTPGSIDDAPEYLEQLQDWATDLIWRYHQVFRPGVQKLEL